MIDINLIPDHLRKRKRKEASSGAEIPREILVGIGGGIMALVILIHAVLLIVLIFKMVQHNHYKARWEAIQPQKSDSDAIAKQMDEIQKQIQSIEEITSGKAVVWSQKLALVSENIPKGVWLKKISLNKKDLIIEGTAVSKEKNEMISVGSFVSNLKKQKEFVKDFLSIEVGLIQRRKNTNLEIADFSINAKLK